MSAITVPSVTPEPPGSDPVAERAIAYLRAMAEGDFDHPEPPSDEPLIAAAIDLVRSFRGAAGTVRHEALALASRAETLIASSSVTAHVADGVSTSADQVNEASGRVSDAVETSPDRCRSCRGRSRRSPAVPR